MIRRTMADRAEAFRLKFPKYEAAWPRVVREAGRDVLYAIWVTGADYRNKSGYYGAYPPRFLSYLMALFPGLLSAPVHVFSGSLPPSPDYIRVDVNPELKPDICCNVYDLPAAWGETRKCELQIADPPYSAEDAKRYGTPMVNRARAVAALSEIAQPGGHLAWLDVQWPLHTKRQWVTVGRILVQGSTMHRARVCSLFERVA